MKIIRITGWLLIIALFAEPIELLAQVSSTEPEPMQTPAPVPASPNAASLGKYAEVPVGSFTGIPNISIPIYEVREGGISLPISLSYYAGGVKVEEVASWVGLGWSLNAGGVISRTVRGTSDLFASGDNYYDAVEEFRSSDMVQKKYQVEDMTKGDIDAEPDIFQYNFGRYSGKFILFPDGKFHSIPLNNLDIKLELNSSDPLRWVITDPMGVRYVFGKSYDNRIAIETNNVTSTKEGGVSEMSGGITSWYLVQVIDASGNKVSLKYEATDFFYQSPDVQIAYFSGQQYIESSTTSVMNVIHGLRISEISFGGGRILFTPQTSERRDLVGDHALNSITIENIDTEIGRKVFSFTYGYFGTSSSVVSARRLRLDSFGEMGKNPYLFSYEFSPPDRLSYDKDHWGYYNAKSNTTHLPTFNLEGMTFVYADKGVNENAMKAGILKMITFPTGGTTAYDFEANQVVGTSLSDDDTYVQKGAVAQLVNDEFYEETFTVANGVGQEAKLYYSGDMYDYLDNGCLQVKISGIDNQRIYIVDSQNPLPPDSSLVLLNGTYKIQLIWIAALGCTLQQNPEEELWISAQLVWREPNVTNPAQYYNVQVGGLRVKKITSKAGPDSPPLTTEFRYNNFYDPILSSGYILTEPIYYSYYKNGFADGSYSMWAKLNSNSNTLYMNGGGYAGYSNVEVLNGIGGVYGKTRYSFTNISEYPDITDEVKFQYPEVIRSDADTEGNLMPIKPPTSYDWRRGRLVEQCDYEYVNSSFRIIRKVENEYEFVSPPDVSTTAEGIVAAIIGYSEPTATGYTFPILSYKYYTVVTDFPFLSDSKETLYSYLPQESSVVKATEYEYNLTHLNPFKVRESVNGGYKSTYLSYSGDYASGTGFIDHLRASHIISVPIERVEVLEDAEGGSPRIVQGELTTYTADGRGLKSEVWRTEAEQPIALSSFKFSSAPQGTLPSSAPLGVFSPDPTYRKKLRFNQYDAKGNIRQFQYEHGNITSYIWGYAGQYPIAEAKNAPANEIYHSNFEEGSGWGGEMSFDDTRSRTGRSAGKLVNPTGSEKTAHATLSTPEDPGNTGYRWLDISLSQPKRFRYSAWVYSDGPRAQLYLFMRDAAGRDAGAYLTHVEVVTTLERGRWVLLEGEATVPADMVQLSLRLDNDGAAYGGQTVWFDDVRLHPADAQMATYTYDPLVGQTSATDANGRPAYYKYDANGRLEMVKDSQGNILKHYEYNYATQQ